MIEKIKSFLTIHKVSVILAGVLILLLVGGAFAFQKSAKKTNVSVERVDLAFDAEGPYAILSPRRDGNAVVLNLKRTASYDAISFELAYTSKADETIVTGNKISNDGESGDEEASGSIERGVVGNIDTGEKKGEYEQEILFGTCSKNVCKYDKGVENGTLTLHIKKQDKAYKMVTQWHLQKPDVALGTLTSSDGHLVYKIDGDRQALSNIGFTITHDLTGVPKLPSGRSILGKVYSLNAPIAKAVNSGVVSLELAENPSSDAKLFRNDPNKNTWQELDTKIEGSELSGKADGAGIFTVLVNKK